MRRAGHSSTRATAAPGSPWRPCRPPETSPLDGEEGRELAERFDAIAATSIPEILDWAESYRGARAGVVENVEELLATGSAWLHGRVRRGTAAGARDQGRALEAFGVLSQCRKALAQRNANPQMVAERALLALREASGR